MLSSELENFSKRCNTATKGKQLANVPRSKIDNYRKQAASL